MNSIKQAVLRRFVILFALCLAFGIQTQAQTFDPAQTFPADLVQISPADATALLSVSRLFRMSSYPNDPPLPPDVLFLILGMGPDGSGSLDSSGSATNYTVYFSASVQGILIDDRAAAAETILVQSAMTENGMMSQADEQDEEDDSDSPTLDTTGLYLQITNMDAAQVYLNLYNASNQVYAIWSTDLAGNWNVETEVWPTTNQDVMPFTVPTSGRDNLFLLAEDWTGVTENGNTTPDWWLWKYFGNLGLTMSDTTLDSSGTNTLLYDFQNGQDPNVISFSIQVTNNYVTTSSPNLQLNVTAGAPSYYTVLVDSTNFSTTNWTAYTTSSITANLGANEGWHEIWVGLRGLPLDAQQTWIWIRLKLDVTPPQLVITGPTNSTVVFPVIQLTGYSPEALSGISYSISNAAGNATGQQAVITGQFYSTNTAEFTTNYFQCYDLPLTNGLNAITLQATDLAGNVATLTTNIVYSPTTNPPAVALLWPQDGMQISGGAFTIQGQVDDPTATASVAVVDADGNTNYYNGLTGRDGNFWVENVPFNTGTNWLSLTLSNSAGATTTNFALTQSSIALSVNPVQAGDTTVTGTIGTNGYTIWVNGVQAAQDSGAWTAQIAPLGVGGGLVQVAATPNSDNSAPSINTQATVDAPQGVFISAYHYNLQSTDIYNATSPNDLWYDILNWQDGQGGTETASFVYDDSNYQGPGTQYDTDWPTNSWPQPLTNGTEETILWLSPGITTNTTTANPPVFQQEHCDINEMPCGGPNTRRTADTEMKLATGGPLGSTQQHLWVITAGASDLATGNPIPPEQISIGGLGNLDTNANLFVMLSDNDPPIITPKVKGDDYYTFGAAGQEYALISKTACSTPTNQARRTLGVGEQVTVTLWNVSLNSPLPGYASALVHWTTSAGRVYPTNGSQTTLTAPSSAASTVTVTMHYLSVAYPINFSVIEPSGVNVILRGPPDTFAIGTVGAGMQMNVFLQPTNVSFDNVQIIEPVATATNIEGYFINTAPPNHDLSHGAGVWHPVLCNNLVSDLDFDHASSYGWSIGQGGSYTWPISPFWRVIGDSRSNALSGWTAQVHTLDADGTMTVSKLGHQVTRSTNQTTGTAQ